MSIWSRDDLGALLDQVISAGEGAPDWNARLQLAKSIREESARSSRRLDEFLIDHVLRLRAGLEEARAKQSELRHVLEKLTATPWHAARYLGQVSTPKGPGAVVMLLGGSTSRVVGFSDGVAPHTINVGDEVLLNHEMNVLMARSPRLTARGGETASFERFTSDGRAVLRARLDEIVVDLAHRLREAGLKLGDQVLWDRNAWIALDKLETAERERLFLEETPAERFEDVGGLEEPIRRLRKQILLHFQRPDIVKGYGLRPKGSVLLVGPPGTGKTMLARGLANFLAAISSSGKARFMNVKPGGLHSSYYAESEANYRKAFERARAEGEREPDVPVVLFFDEVDSIGASRDHSLVRYDDRVLNSFMAELDGFESRGNVLVVAATNRLETLDPALRRPGRLGDLILKIPRPDRKAARDIFSKHVKKDIPVAGDAGARDEMLDAAVSRIFSPNGGNELATITFRNGKQRSVTARDLVSGAMIANVVRAALECACLREMETGIRGLTLPDVLTALDDELHSAIHGLTPANCRSFVEQLPQDVDVVAVKPTEARVRKTHRYLTVA